MLSSQYTRARSLYNLHNNATLFLRNLPIVSPQTGEYIILRKTTCLAGPEKDNEFCACCLRRYEQ